MSVPVLLLTGTVGAGETTIAYDDFVVENGDRPTRDVAMEVLTEAGWL